MFAVLLALLSTLLHCVAKQGSEKVCLAFKLGKESLSCASSSAQKGGEHFKLKMHKDDEVSSKAEREERVFNSKDFPMQIATT